MNLGGRPPKFKNPEDMQVLINEYFANEPILTITGLVLHLGFADRKSFYSYEKKPRFSHTIKKARTMIENGYEKMLAGGGQAAGPIFALKNFGWTDKQESESVEDKQPINITILNPNDS